MDRLSPLLEKAPGVRGVLGRLPFDDATLEAIGAERYITSFDRRMFFVFVQPEDPHSSTETIEPFVEAVRRIIRDPSLASAGIRAGLTGMPAYALDDRDVVRRDVLILSGASFLLVILLFVVVYGSLPRPALAGAALLAAQALTLGAVALWPGHLTLLSAFFASILFGLGVDYVILPVLAG